MVLDAFARAIMSLGSVELWLIVIAGVIIGLIFGVVPGISGMTALALILPFAFKMTPWQCLPLMMAVMAVVFNGGAITAILLNLPGTPANAATVVDGFRMTQKGEGARALGAAQMASGVGGTFSALLALVMIPLILPMVMSIQSADMVFVVLFGLVFVGVLGAGSMVKGLISGAIGLLLSFVGYNAVTGLGRFTFGLGYLYDGLPVAPMALGLFAVPEIIRMATRGGTISQTGVVLGMKGVWQGVRDVVHHWSLVLRGGIIGFIVGVIPGIGGTTAAFVSYAQSRKTSKHPELFGSGTVEGVIAPEAANNAEEAGALLTTLALGIPGSGTQTLVLGAIIMMGIVPGPEMFTRYLDLSIALMLIIIIAGNIASIGCLLLSPYMAKIALIPIRYLVPLILVVTFVGAFATFRVIEDVFVTFALGLVGLVMSKFDFNRPALFLAYVLGYEFERYVFISVQNSGALFFLRPISLTLIILMIAMFAYGPLKSLFLRRRGVKTE